MTILQALAGFYGRLEARGSASGRAEIPAFGLKPAEIGFVLEIEADGRPAALKPLIAADARRGPKFLMPGAAFNPAPKPGEPHWEDLSCSGRTSGRRSYLFWDKTSYVFGVAGKKAKGAKGPGLEPEVNEKTQQDHEAFAAAHQALLSPATHPEFRALLRFLERWQPQDWEASGFPDAALDGNVAFQVRGFLKRIDQTAAAQTLALQAVSSRTPARPCLISGEIKSYAAKHPQFKGVAGAQSSGAALVSFNADAFKSFGLDQGANAPVSEAAAFKYGAALNWLLDPFNGRCLHFGETTIVFWAGGKHFGEAAAEAAEDRFWRAFGAGASGGGEDGDGEADGGDDRGPRDTAQKAAKLGGEAPTVRPLRKPPGLPEPNPQTRLHVLGLSPNSGRLAVRFWLVESFGQLEENLKRHQRDMALAPGPRPGQKAYALLYETAAQGKRVNIPPRLGGELAAAILAGARYPRTLFAAVIARIRADKTVNAARAGLCKAVINRDCDAEVIPVTLNPESEDGAYNLGRLFAVYEYAERSAASREAAFRGKFIGLAAASPRRAFPLLMRGYEQHAAALAKGAAHKRGAGGKAAKAVAQILGRFGAAMPFPAALPIEGQARFFVGYYHQRAALYTKPAEGAPLKDGAGPEGEEP